MLSIFGTGKQKNIEGIICMVQMQQKCINQTSTKKSGQVGIALLYSRDGE
jgi:hypothetical protein